MWSVGWRAGDNNPYGKGKKGPWLQRTTKVGSYAPNKLGVYDMHGNVREWCSDLIGGSDRVIRGGSWYDDGGDCRAAVRAWDSPSNRDDNLGFRLARVPAR